MLQHKVQIYNKNLKASFMYKYIFCKLYQQEREQINRTKIMTQLLTSICNFLPQTYKQSWWPLWPKHLPSLKHVFRWLFTSANSKDKWLRLIHNFWLHKWLTWKVGSKLVQLFPRKKRIRCTLLLNFLPLNVWLTTPYPEGVVWPCQRMHVPIDFELLSFSFKWHISASDSSDLKSKDMLLW